MDAIKKMYMMKSCRKILEQCLNVQPKENLLILTDINTAEIGEMFSLVGEEMEAEVVMTIMMPTSRHGDEPPRIIAEAMKAADAIVAPTTYSVNHSSARKAASDAGARLIFMPDANEEIFLDGSLDIDYLEQKKKIDKLSKILEEGSEIRIRSALGSDIKMDIRGRHAVPQTGICHEPGSISPPPCIESAVAPVEGSTEGVMYVDGAIVPGRPCEEPVKLTFEEGKIVSIEGGQDAKMLEELLASYDHPNVYHAVEMGMGMNPKAKIGRGGQTEDEAEFGTMHIGIGNGITFGSSIRAPGHCDLVMRDPMIEVDGKLLMKDREIFLD
ncbi:aminopeptidase [Alteribacillus iranensis]|uniref:Leucyl aminopeptidase (Aminopeptidase T) n=1 Tax=Alteribacillus iranensis TaxID=930128 RepID=A0A1I2BI83_9BACI|nr:aminopeptidase [Alteribacillus iranensis]SFE55779.1 Leucyl aminopeptidase (aminopeptidase T) [Alteribacillus iranensis]